MKCSPRLMGLMLVAVSLAGLRAAAGGMNEPDKKALANLRWIGQSCMMYANANKGWLPADFGVIADDQLDGRVFLDPRLHSVPPPEWLKWTKDQKRDWVNAHCEFDFTAIGGTKITKVKDPAQTPLVTSRAKDGVHPVTLFADGHAEVSSGPTTGPATAPATQP